MSRFNTVQLHFLRLLKHRSGASILVMVMVACNGLNMIFNIVLGRFLALDHFGVLTLVNTLGYLANVLVGAVGSTVNHKTAYWTGKKTPEKASGFLKHTVQNSVLIFGGVTLIWILLLPFLSHYFQVPNIWVMALFSPMWLGGLLIAIGRGYLQGQLRFGHVAISYLVENLTKIAVAFGLLLLGYATWVFIAIPIGIMAGVATLLIAISHDWRASTQEQASKFPWSFYMASIGSSVAMIMFTSIDVALAKHYLSPAAAGAYALLSLVGKMIFFMGTLCTHFLLTAISHEEGKGGNSHHLLLKLAGITAVVVFSAWLGLAILGERIVYLVWGEKTVLILPYIAQYGLAIAVFSLANTIEVYHLARKNYIFSGVAVITAGVLIGAIGWRHEHIGSFVSVLSGVSFFYLAIMIGMHSLSLVWDSLRWNWNGFRQFIHRRPTDEFQESDLKVLIFNWRDLRHRYAGGAEVYVHEMAKRWVRSGIKVTLFCGNDGISKWHESIEGVEIYRHGGFYTVYGWAFWYYLWHFRGRYDVVVDCHNGIPFFTPLFVREPILTVLHHVHQEIFHRHLAKPLAWFAATLESQLMPRIYADTPFITISASSLKTMKQWGITGKGIQVVHPGVDLASLKPGKKSPVPTILYLGRLQAYKSVDVLIQAVVTLKNRLPHLRVIIAGKGEAEKQLKALVKKLQLNSIIEFVGKVTEDQKQTLLQQAWVAVNPSFMEGWGITTIEANACGTPVVAANVPGLRDSVRNPHTGFLVPYGDPKVLATKIEEVLSNDTLRKTMSIEATKWAKKFDWDQTSSQFLKIIETVGKNRERNLPSQGAFVAEIRAH